MIKTITAEIKAAGPDDGLGDMQFTGYASVFGNKDSYGDVVMPGAFTETLAEWAQRPSKKIPCLWGHDQATPLAIVGGVIDAKEDDHGLLVKVQLKSNEWGQATYESLKDGTAQALSFAYEVRDGAMAKSDELGDYYELRKLHLYEVSVVGIPANPAAGVLAVKENAERLVADIKAGRTISAKNEATLRQAYDAIGTVLTQLEPDSEKARGAAKNEEPPGVKFEEPTRITPGSLLADALELELSF